jgi:hypothetical protein
VGRRCMHFGGSGPNYDPWIIRIQYADMLVTLYEDGYLKLTEGQIISKIDNSERVKTRAFSK